MNNKQRKKLYEEKVRLGNAHDIIESVRENLEEMYGEEQDKYDNLPEGLQESEMGEKLQEISELLEDASYDLDSISGEISDVLEKIDEVIDM
jgi:DNA repair ATPase RecN